MTAFIEQYDIDFWLLHNRAFKPRYVHNNDLIHQFKMRNYTADHLAAKQLPQLAKSYPNCAAFKTEQFRLLDAQCLASCLSN